MISQNNRELSIWKKVDRWFLILFMMLITAGLLTVYSSSMGDELTPIYDLTKDYGKQFLWVIISLFVGFIILYLDGNFIRNSSFIIYGIVITMLLLVLLTPPINGARAWFKLGNFTIQPAEFAKLACSLAVAKFLNTTGLKMESFGTVRTVIFILIIPMGLIFIEPDPGSSLVFLSFIFVMYREGLSGNILLGGLFAAIFAVIAVYIKCFEDATLFDGALQGNYIFAGAILLLGVLSFALIKMLIMPRYRRSKYKIALFSTVLALTLVLSANWAYDNAFKDRHRTRFKILFGLVEDRKGDGYNIYQALSAIGSGEFIGKGYMGGTLSNDKFKHVPEQSTDFIFCSWAEERGFLGSLFLIGLYSVFLIKTITIAERQRSRFTRIFGYCVASIMFFHFMINIAMVIGIAPVIGIPLPLFSKGGSAILTFSVMIFILARLDAERKDVLR
jgi:rod shape determining protein RodA